MLHFFNYMKSSAYYLAFLVFVPSIALKAEEKIIDPRPRYFFFDNNYPEFNQSFMSDHIIGDVGLMNLPHENFKSSDGKSDMFVAVDRNGQAYVITKDAQGKTLSGVVIPKENLGTEAMTALNQLKIQKEVAEMEAYVREKERAEGKTDKLAHYFIQGVKQMDIKGNNYYDMTIVIEQNAERRTRDSFIAKRGEKVAKRLQDRYKKIEKEFERRLVVGGDGHLYMTDAKGKKKVLMARNYAQLSKDKQMNFYETRETISGLERNEHPSVIDTREDDAHHHIGPVADQFEGYGVDNIRIE